jgi:cob(I)alamin adenosyltransferase
VQEIATRFSIPVGTVKRRLYDARRQLRLLLSARLPERLAQKGALMPRLFTRRGDQGRTDLIGTRVTKAAPQVQLLGILDEATAAIGLSHAWAASAQMKQLLFDVQRDLYRMMAGVAVSGAEIPTGYALKPNRVDWLETTINELGGQLEIPAHFILPGDSVAGATLDVARTVVRRAERAAVALATHDTMHDPQLLSYLNRLSLFLFVVARVEDHEAGVVPLQAARTLEERESEVSHDVDVP